MSTEPPLVERLADGVERRLTELKRIGGLLERERRTFRSVDLPLRERLWLWRHGFLSEAGLLFDLSPETVDDYLSNYDRDVKTIDINGEAGYVLDDKLLFHDLLTPEFESLVPRLRYFVTGEGAYPVDADRTFRDVLNADSWEEPLVVKTRTGGGGAGVDVLSPDDGGDELADLLDGTDDRLVYEFVEQAAYADSIFPRATNTVRILTMIDPRTRNPFVARAVHRFGSSDSAPIDNWTSGGVSARIDRETGRLVECAYRTDGGLQRVERHPGTDELIAGTRIPNWNRIVDELLGVAAAYPGLPYVGWDVVVTDDPPFFKVLEGNRYSDVDILQTYGPLLDDPRVRRFYAHHGVV